MTIATPTLIAAGLSVGLIAVSQVDRSPFFIWNRSESVPIGLYLLRPSITPTLGDLAAVRLSVELSAWAVRQGYVGAGTLLLKRVAAISGMTVCRDGPAVSVNSTIVAIAADADRNGRPLPSWAGCVSLGPDQVFLLNADVDDSLDGRYFGTVSSGQIVGQVLPLWTRGG